MSMELKYNSDHINMSHVRYVLKESYENTMHQFGKKQNYELDFLVDTFFNNVFFDRDYCTEIVDVQDVNRIY